MSEDELIKAGSEVVSKGLKQLAHKIFGGLGFILRAAQDRQNLAADVAAIKELEEIGLVGNFAGLSMEFEPYVYAREEEEKRLITNTVNTLLKADTEVDWGKADIETFNPEFGRRWGAEASNVADETLQQLWARLLKGELESPGSVSNDTLTVARDMTKERAEEFQILCSAALYDPAGSPRIVVGCGQPGQDSLRPYGLSYDALMRLAHHRLIIGDMGSRINFSGSRREISSIFSHQGETWVLRSPTGSDSPATTRSISGILFTPAGQELFRVVERIPVPAYTQAMFEYLEKEGWTAIPFPPPSKAHNT